MMTSEEFDMVLSFRLSNIQEVLGKKAAEYAIGGDRLHNFELASKLSGQTRERALWGMAMKHLVSVVDLIEQHEEYDKTPTEYMVNEKIGDLINYLILLEASFKNRIERAKENEELQRHHHECIGSGVGTDGFWFANGNMVYPTSVGGTGIKTSNS